MTFRGRKHDVLSESRVRENRLPWLCVQKRLVCSAGVSPAGVKVRSPVAWIAGWRETKTLKPIDKTIERMVARHRAVTKVNAR